MGVIWPENCGRCDRCDKISDDSTQPITKVGTENAHSQLTVFDIHKIFIDISGFCTQDAIGGASLMYFRLHRHVFKLKLDREISGSVGWQLISEPPRGAGLYLLYTVINPTLQSSFLLKTSPGGCLSSFGEQAVCA